MQTSCKTFEAFVVTLSLGIARVPPLPNRADPGPGTQPVQQLLDVSWQVQHSPPDGHSDFLPLPQWHTVAWRYFDSSPFPTHVIMSARVFNPAVVQDRSHSIPVFYRDRWLSSPCRHLVPSALFPIHTLSKTVSSTTSDLHEVLCTANRPHAHKRECLVSHVGTHPRMGKRLVELHVK